jgi:integrase
MVDLPVCGPAFYNSIEHGGQTMLKKTPDLLAVFRGRRSAAREDDSIDRRGYARSPVTKAGYRRGQAPANKGRTFPAEPLTRREMLTMIDSFPSGACGERNLAMVVTMWRTGIRVGEACALYPKDLDTDRGQLAVLHGKGDRDRRIGIDISTAAMLDPWLRRRKKLGLNGSHPLFCVVSKPTTGLPLHAAYVRNMVKDAGLRSGIEKRVHPHGLRHTHAFELADERIDLRLIRQQLGHSNLAITARYIEHLNPSEVVEAIRARRWPTLDQPETPHPGESLPPAVIAQIAALLLAEGIGGGRSLEASGAS